MSERAAGEGRIALIDALRGLSIILMVAYHFGYDLVIFLGLPRTLVFNPLLGALQPIFAGVFILISGVSCNFSRSNIKRSLMLIAFALGLTALTLFAQHLLTESGSKSRVAVIFGILHFLGCASVLYGLGRKYIDRIPARALLFGALFIGGYLIFPIHADIPYLWWAGIIPPGFTSSDYFPLLPWIFLFFLGTWLGGVIKAGRFPGWFYSLRIPVLPTVGRYTLVIYLAHQPLLLGVIFLLSLI